MKKTETASPTDMAKSIFTTTVIDVKEGKDVSTFDLPGAFTMMRM